MIIRKGQIVMQSRIVSTRLLFHVKKAKVSGGFLRDKGRVIITMVSDRDIHVHHLDGLADRIPINTLMNPTSKSHIFSVRDTTDLQQRPEKGTISKVLQFKSEGLQTVKVLFQSIDFGAVHSIDPIIGIEPQAVGASCFIQRKIAGRRKVIMPRIGIDTSGIPPCQIGRVVGRAGIHHHDFIGKSPDRL
nr:hypothetical protein [Desulfosoma caldarium]